MERIYCSKKALEGLCTWTLTVSLTRFVCSNLEMPFLIIYLANHKIFEGLDIRKTGISAFSIDSEYD